MQLELLNTQFLKLLKKNINNENTFNAWFKEIIIISINKSNAILAVPNNFTKKLLAKTYLDLITKTIAAICNTNITVNFVKKQSDDYSKVLNDIEERKSKETSTATLSINNLNPKYTFEGFVIGENNRFAHAACLAAAETPAKIYNPIFIYGGVGLGKTHLMHAMGFHYLKANPKANVLYVSSETFTNELINAIQKGSIDKFRNKYRSIDFLLIDDIQFLENKEKTQDEFFHTFNTLKDANKQIVISSDDAPKKLNVEERLISRFAWGLSTDIGQPDFETRVAIIKKKADIDEIELPEEAYHIIAKRITSNIRELEGALLRVDAYITINNIKKEDITENFIETILKDIINNAITMQINDKAIKKAVATFYGLSEEDLNSKRRSRNISFPRQIAMYLIRDMTELSLPKIGKSFGGKDHTTVMHACDKIAISISINPEVKQVVEQIKESLETGKF